MDNKLNPSLEPASLSMACDMAKSLTATAHMSRTTVEEIAFEIHYVLDHLRRNYDLVPKK